MDKKLLQKFNIFFFIFSISLFGVNQNSSNYIFVSCSAGDSVHEAINQYIHKESLFDEKIFFCPSCDIALDDACEKKGKVFIKLFDEPTHIVAKQTLKALQNYHIQKVIYIVKQEIHYAILRHKEAIKKGMAFRHIASQPTILEAIHPWVLKKKLIEIEVPYSSSEAARLLSEKELPLTCGVVCSKQACKIYTNLVVSKNSIPIPHKMYEIYALMEVEKREKPQEAKELLQKLEKLR